MHGIGIFQNRGKAIRCLDLSAVTIVIRMFYEKAHGGFLKTCSRTATLNERLYEKTRTAHCVKVCRSWLSAHTILPRISFVLCIDVGNVSSDKTTCCHFRNWHTLAVGPARKTPPLVRYSGSMQGRSVCHVFACPLASAIAMDLEKTIRMYFGVQSRRALTVL